MTTLPASQWREGGEQDRRLFRNGSEDITIFNVYLGHRMAIMCGEAPTLHSRIRDQFACEFARGVAWGLQPMVHKLLSEHQTEPRWAEEWKFIKDTAAFYHANRAFLFDGEMRDPGTMRCSRKPVDFFVRGCYTKEEKFRSVHEPGLPVVFHSVWKAPDGRCAAVLVNWTREPAAYDLKTPDVSASGILPPRTWRLVPYL